MHGLVTPEGGNLADSFLIENYDLETLLLEGEIKDLTETDSCVWRDSNIDKNTSCWYNYLPKQYVGNYRNWVFAQSAKDWSISSYRANFDLLHRLAKEGLLVNTSDDLSRSWGVVYNWYFLDIKMSDQCRLDIPCLTPEEMSQASSRD